LRGNPLGKGGGGQEQDRRWVKNEINREEIGGPAYKRFDPHEKHVVDTTTPQKPTLEKGNALEEVQAIEGQREDSGKQHLGRKNNESNAKNARERLELQLGRRMIRW